MVQKRPFDAEEILEVSFKHPKHGEPNKQLVSFSESVFPDDGCYTHMPKTSEGGCGRDSSDGNEKHAGEVPRGTEDSEASFPVAWATSSTAEDVKSESPAHLALFPEYFHSEPPVHLALFPEYFSPEKPFRTLARYDDIYSILLEHPPRKPVSIGANHQADIPAWDFSGATDRPNASDALPDGAVGDEAEKRLMGTCIIPMPEMELSINYDEVGKGRSDCSCEDRGSMRCVKQHIVEEREKLLKDLGHEKFAEVGLADMGEQLAEKWSAEDERIFHEVVFNNPASLGRNFWNYLSIAFPSRTKKEIVSYYFNVFMLQKRAEQNRNDPLNIDSDNDEWQGSDGNDIATREEDEDSDVESPVCQHDTCFTNCHENDPHDSDEVFATDETFDANGTSVVTERNIDDDDNIDDDSKYDPVAGCNSSGFCRLIQPQDQTGCQDPCDEKVKDDSCTLSNTILSSEETKMKSGNGDQWSGNYSGVSNGYSQGHVLEPCDAKVWDPAFVSCSKNKIDFLPTCTMIEEVFGDGRRQEMRRA